MAERVKTAGGTPVGGWVLRGDRSTFDVGPMIERYGQVYRYPVEPGDRADLMAPGQPCFLYLTDTSRVVGLWGIGEVVAPVLLVPDDPASIEGPATLMTEVEILPLAKPIAESRLRAEKVLAGSEMFTAADLPNPLVLEPRAVRAIESFEFELVSPTDEQADRLDVLLAAEEHLDG